MIVVDANILVYRMVVCQKTDEALRILEIDSDWKFPALWEYEFGNILAQMVNRNTMAPKDAAHILEMALDIFASGITKVDAFTALRLSVDHRLTFYDAQYLALAKSLGVPLVTEDKGLRKAGSGIAVNMEEFLN